MSQHRELKDIIKHPRTMKDTGHHWQKICGCYDTRLCLETGMRFITTTHRDEMRMMGVSAILPLHIFIISPKLHADSHSARYIFKCASTIDPVRRCDHVCVYNPVTAAHQGSKAKITLTDASDCSNQTPPRESRLHTYTSTFTRSGMD